MKTYLQLVMVLLLTGAATAFGATPVKQSEAAEKSAKAKRERILAEIKKLGDHDWAGEYYSGDGMGVNTSLTLAPRSGYVFEWHGCLGLYDRNYGDVDWRAGRIRLTFTFKNSREGLQGIAPVLILVPWGERRYLVPSNEIVEFCNNVNQGREPRPGEHGFFLLRRGDEDKEVEGFPKVPAKYRDYLLPKPVEATIIAVGQYVTRPSVLDWKFKDTPVTLDAGATQGLRIGMELIVSKPDSKAETVQITKVEDNRAEAVMTQAGEDEPGPEVGWRLSTQAPWRTKK